MCVTAEPPPTTTSPPICPAVNAFSLSAKFSVSPLFRPALGSATTFILAAAVDDVGRAERRRSSRSNAAAAYFQRSVVHVVK